MRTMEWPLLRKGAIFLQTRTKYVLGVIFGLAWLAVIAGGFSVFLKYDTKPGPQGAAPQQWPHVTFARATSRPTLVMVAHPLCPCTRASIGELAQIMARLQGKVLAYVLFVKPTNSSAEWDDTNLQRSAAKIPGVTVRSDPGGADASKFGAETSGQTLLFAADGHLLFSGGITESRGHAGDNAGEQAIISLVRNGAANPKHSFVFGCTLANRNGRARP